MITPQVKYGWVCPLCQVVHAPDVRQCHCQNQAKVTGPAIAGFPRGIPSHLDDVYGQQMGAIGQQAK